MFLAQVASAESVHRPNSLPLRSCAMQDGPATAGAPLPSGAGPANIPGVTAGVCVAEATSSSARSVEPGQQQREERRDKLLRQVVKKKELLPLAKGVSWVRHFMKTIKDNFQDEAASSDASKARVLCLPCMDEWYPDGWPDKIPARLPLFLLDLSNNSKHLIRKHNQGTTLIADAVRLHREQKGGAYDRAKMAHHAVREQETTGQQSMMTFLVQEISEQDRINDAAVSLLINTTTMLPLQFFREEAVQNLFDTKGGVRLPETNDTTKKVLAGKAGVLRHQITKEVQYILEFNYNLPSFTIINDGGTLLMNGWRVLFVSLVGRNEWMQVIRVALSVAYPPAHKRRTA